MDEAPQGTVAGGVTMSAVHIRHAVEADAEAISSINGVVQGAHAQGAPGIFKQPSRSTFPESEVISLLQNPDNIFLVACEDGRPVGYIFAQVVHSAVSSLLHPFERIYIHHLAVLQSREGRGFGTALVDGLLKSAKSRGISTVVLDVWTFNDRARQFLAGRGFTVFVERMWKNI
jgi:ribosomal protein S18 acetylase RimI-like enzyme